MFGELSCFVGLRLWHFSSYIFINQSKYISNIQKKITLVDCKFAKTPMSLTTRIITDTLGKDVNSTLYKGMIGSLSYLIVSCHDIMFETIMFARFQANLKGSHVLAVKRIFLYLKHTPKLGQWCLRD